MERIDKILIPVLAILAASGILVWVFPFNDFSGRVWKNNSNELVLAMSHFKVGIDKNGKQVYTAGDAQVWIVHPDEGWKRDVIKNPDSDVAHKAAIGDLNGDGRNEIYVAGGQNATLNMYRKVNGSWKGETIWRPGFVRIRDIEIGDVDSDGRQELVAGTHRDGVVEVIENENGVWKKTETDRAADTYIHEIEIADIDGDGINEFFSNPTEPNLRRGLPQLGSIAMYKWNGSSYERVTVEDINDSHAKEFAVGDVDNDGKPELVAAVWGIAGESNASDQEIQDNVVKVRVAVPVRIRLYEFDGKAFRKEDIAEIPDIKTRSLRIGDADNDGLNELVIGTDTRGLQIVRKTSSGWKGEVIDSNLTGNIHEVMIVDADRDGRNEIIANSDKLGVVNTYSWTGSRWEKKTVLKGLEGYWVWAMDFGDADNE